jgi:O-antigen/teichoic acid export membrane protein
MFIILQGNYWYPAIASIVGLSASLLAGYSLIPIYGLYGAIATTLLGLFWLTIGADLIFNKKNIVALFSCYGEFDYFWGILKRRMGSS